MTETDQPKYPDALSRRLSERGYTFLHRVFRKCIDSGKPVIINTGSLYYQYQYLPTNRTFEEGLTLVDGSDEDTEKGFLQVVRSFELDLAIFEGGYQKSNDGTLLKIETHEV